MPGVGDIARSGVAGCCSLLCLGFGGILLLPGIAMTASGYSDDFDDDIFDDTRSIGLALLIIGLVLVGVGVALCFYTCKYVNRASHGTTSGGTIISTGAPGGKVTQYTSITTTTPQQAGMPYQPPPGGAYPAPGGQYPPQGGAYPPAGHGYPAQAQQYPQYPPQAGYPPPQGPPQGAYPPPQGAYPPPQGAYPSPQGAYPPPQPAYHPPQPAQPYSEPPPNYPQHAAASAPPPAENPPPYAPGTHY